MIDLETYQQANIHTSPSLFTPIYINSTSEEAAVVEWGHSAIISALDGAVAAFGPQTSQGVSI